MKKGLFITFEGLDGAGKSTQIQKVKEIFEKKGYEVVLTREPGGTEISEKIRKIILDNDNEEMSFVTEALLYAASRAQHVHEKIKPAIENGKVVICDRYVHSSIAYQGYGRELGADKVMNINSHAIDNIMPDISFFILLPSDKAMERLKSSQRELDRLEVEKISFFKRVEEGYSKIADKYDNIIKIDASKSVDTIAHIISDKIIAEINCWNQQKRVLVMKESDLYPHIKEFLIEQDYDVKAEIIDCDIMAVKDDTVIVVEMKTNLNLALLGQAVERQLLFEIVYIAVPKPKYKKRFSSQYKRTIRLVKRLSLGLLYVDFRGEGICFEEFPPKIFKYGINKTRKEKLREKAIKEFEGLSGDYNVGGTNKIKKMTAYKETALSIAMYLNIYGPTRASIIRDFGCGEKTWSIMYKNFYGWFEKVGNGVYKITSDGEQALCDNSKVCEALRKTLFSDTK